MSTARFVHGRRPWAYRFPILSYTVMTVGLASPDGGASARRLTPISRMTALTLILEAAEHVDERALWTTQAGR
jgi:hypothetical protein